MNKTNINKSIVSQSSVNQSLVSRSLINGIASDFLSVNDRAIHYGDGIFETILCDVNNVNARQAVLLAATLSAVKVVCR